MKLIVWMSMKAGELLEAWHNRRLKVKYEKIQEEEFAERNCYCPKDQHPRSNTKRRVDIPEGMVNLDDHPEIARAIKKSRENDAIVREYLTQQARLAGQVH